MSCSSYSHRAIDKVKLNDNFCRIRVNLSSINLTSLNFLAKIRASQLEFEVLLKNFWEWEWKLLFALLSILRKSQYKNFKHVSSLEIIMKNWSFVTFWSSLANARSLLTEEWHFHFLSPACIEAYKVGLCVTSLKRKTYSFCSSIDDRVSLDFNSVSLFFSVAKLPVDWDRLLVVLAFKDFSSKSVSKLRRIQLGVEVDSMWSLGEVDSENCKKKSFNTS